MDKRKLPLKKSVRIKIISMGNAEVGKSCIIKRYCEKRFVHKYLATIGIDYGVTKVNIKDKEVKVNIFDMAGHPIFYEVRNEFYKDTQGALLVFDVSDRSSFEALDHWLTELRNEIGNQTEAENVFFVVCGNKKMDWTAGLQAYNKFSPVVSRTDRKRAVDETEGRVWADTRGFNYYETTAQNGDNINEMFQCLFEGVLNAVENGGKRQPITTQLGYTKEQIDAIQRLKNAKDNYERLGLWPGATKDEINKSYRKLAVLLHPDKSVAPGSEEAFKLLVAARTALLKNAR